MLITEITWTTHFLKLSKGVVVVEEIGYSDVKSVLSRNKKTLISRNTQ